MYVGKLPNYALKANEAKLVKMFCKDCSSTRWAEMNVDYPGQETLRGPNLKGLTATCLKCGFKAVDSYNWHRY